MPLNYRKNDITLTSEYYSDVNDLNGPGVCKDTKVNLVVGNERKYIGLVDSGHEQASDLSVQVGNKTLKLAKKSKYMVGQSDYALNFKAIGENDFKLPPDFGGKTKYDEFVSISENHEIVKIFEISQYFKLLNVIQNGGQEKTVYWKKGFLTFEDFPFQVMDYASYNDLKMIITKDNKFYEWYESRDWRSDKIYFYKNNSDNFINDVNNSQDVVKINSLNELTNKYPNISFSSMSIGTHYTGVHVLFLDTTGKLYVKGNNDYGQLGFNTKSIIDIKIPQNILENETFKKVYASQATSAAIDLNNNLYIWGDHRTSLGFGDYSSSFVPRKLQSNGVDIKVADIVFGYYAILVLDIFGKIYSWGSNGHGELGHGVDSTTQLTPLLISINPLTVFTSLSIQSRLIVAITNDNKLYVWGKDHYWLQENMLINDGSDNFFNYFVPTQILNNFQIKKMMIRFFLTVSGQIFELKNNNLPLLISGSNIFKDFILDSNNQFSITIQNKLMGKGTNSSNELLKKTIETEFVDLNIDLEIKQIVISGTDKIFITKLNEFYAYRRNINTDQSELINYTQQMHEILGSSSYDKLYLLSEMSGGEVETESIFYLFVDTTNNKNLIFNPRNGILQEILQGKKIINAINLFILADDNKVYIIVKELLDPLTLQPVSDNYLDYPDWDTYQSALRNAKINIKMESISETEIDSFSFPSFGFYGNPSNSFLAIGKNKKLYVMGENSSGQLGNVIGENCDNRVTSLTMICPECSFLKASIIGQTSMAIGEDKKLYTWGSNYDWQLGVDPLSCEIQLPPPFEGADPVVTNLYTSKDFINLLPHCQFLDIAQGSGTSMMAIDITGKIYAWGNNPYHLFGNEMYSEIKQIGQVDLSKYSKINVGDMNSILEEKIVNDLPGAWLGENEFLLDEENVHQPD